MTLRPSDVRRWVLALPLRRDNEAECFGDEANANFQRRVVSRAPDLPPLDLDSKDLDWSLLLAFNISSILYGGLHALAWNAEFHSDTRRGLWRLSCVGVMGFFALCSLMLYIERVLFEAPKAKTKSLRACHFVLYRLGLAGITFFSGLWTFLAARTLTKCRSGANPCLTYRACNGRLNSTSLLLHNRGSRQGFRSLAL